MKDTKTVLPTVNGNGDNKNGYAAKHKTFDHDSAAMTSTTMNESTTKTTTESEELVGGCCVCSDDQGFANNALVYCDGKGCTVACHTACYGIVSIPDGDWYCDRCEANDIRAPCRLCPTIEGAMKRTSDDGWAHVVCALYIPEVSFGDDSTMEPIVLSKIPSTRFGQECSICVQNGRSKLISTSGACCSCTVKNCSQVFHVTCAQANGLLCEDVRKNNCQYPIYCEQHRPKLSKFIRQIAAFSYSPNSIATAEQLTRQHSLSKEKESPSQLSDFVAAAAAADTRSTDNNLPSSNADETHNQSISNDEQQTPVSRSSHSIDVLPRKASSNANSSISSSTSISPLVQPKSHSRSSSTSSSSNSSIQKKSKTNDDANQSLNDLSQFVQLNKEERSFRPPAPPSTSTSDKESPRIDSQQSVEEKSLASRFSTSSSTDSNGKSSSIKQRHSIETASPSQVKSSAFKKSPAPNAKDDERDEDFQMNKKRKISIKFNKDGQPRKQRQHSTEGGPRPVGRPPSKKTLLVQQMTNGVKRPISKSTSGNNNMKRAKVNDTLITMQQNSSDFDHEQETKIKARSNTFYPCDHFGNQINADAYPHEHISSSDNHEETSRHRLPSSSTATARIDFYPRRPLTDTAAAAASSSSSESQQQRTFPPQTLEEFLEHEWELSSDFLLQQTMPHDVSSLLSCLYQFKSENAALQKKFDELRHRRDSLRVTNANLRRRLAEILPINETMPSNTVTQISPPSTAAAPISLPLPQVPPAPVVAPPVLPPVPQSPRKEQQQMKQQKLLAELELQQQLQHQKSSISPTRRRLSTNASHSHPSEFSQPATIKKSKSPRQSSSALTHPSILENQLRQSAMNNSMKKVTATPSTSSSSNPTVKRLPTEIEPIVHSTPPMTGTSSTSPSPYEQIDVAATAAAAYALAKNGRPAAANAGLSLELLSQILAASGNAISPQLFAPTWNISNFGYANFPGANPMSVSDESILRSYAPPSHPSLEQQPSTKPQP